AAGAGEVAARFAGARARASRRKSDDQGGRARDRDDESQFGTKRREERIPAGFVFSAERRSDPCAAAARADGGCSLPERPIYVSHGSEARRASERNFRGLPGCID